MVKFHKKSSACSFYGFPIKVIIQITYLEFEIRVILAPRLNSVSIDETLLRIVLS